METVSKQWWREIMIQSFVEWKHHIGYKNRTNISDPLLVWSYYRLLSFVSAYLLGMQHIDDIVMTGWFRVRIVCRSLLTDLPVSCCFCVLAHYSLVFSRVCSVGQWFSFRNVWNSCRLTLYYKQLIQLLCESEYCE